MTASIKVLAGASCMVSAIPAPTWAVDSGESTGVTAHGDIVNLAARLQAEAVPGTVVMSDAMLRQVEGMVETEPAGVYHFKGKSEQQLVHRLVAIKDNFTRFDAAVARGLTSFDRNAGTMAHATGLLLEGRVEEGLAQLLSMKKWALAHRWAYAASGVDFAAGPALAMTGKIGEGIRTLKTAITDSDTTGSLAIASWNRLTLAELYLGILSTRRPRPPIRFILLNLFSILKVKLFGLRQVRLLLEQLSLNNQIHPESTTRARIELDLARVCLKENARDLARQHLAKARSAALAQASTFLLYEIDAITASVGRL